MIIVFGTLNIDIYIPAGALPDAGQHIRLDNYESFPGGKGANQAFAASRTGVKTAIIGQIGDDGFGRRSTRNLKKESILGAGIGTSEKPTGCSFLLPGVGEDKTIISCASANLDTTSNQIPNEILMPKNMVVAQLLVPFEETLDLFTRAQERGCKTVLNTSPPQYIKAELLEKTDIVFVNKSELTILLETLRLDTEGDEFERTQRLCDAYSIDCITTCGSKGAVAVYHGQKYSIPAFQIDKVVDATGAGDCFLGYLVGLLNQGYDFATAFQYSAIAGSLACEQLGAQSSVPFLEDIIEKAKEFQATDVINS